MDPFLLANLLISSRDNLRNNKVEFNYSDRRAIEDLSKSIDMFTDELKKQRIQQELKDKEPSKPKQIADNQPQKHTYYTKTQYVVKDSPENTYYTSDSPYKGITEEEYNKFSKKIDDDMEDIIHKFLDGTL